MSKRRSIYIESFGHRNPIPAACRIGSLLVSGIVYGLDPATGKAAPGLQAQCALMFQHVRTIVEAGGGTVADIVKITLWLQDRDRRDPVNHEWLRMFPDPQDRPARQAMQADLPEGVLVQCDFVANILD